MPKTVRIKATPTKDKNLYVKLEQDFDLLEILSLKIVKSDVYTRMCADYGVVVGRAVANSGFGIPNAKMSIFIPLTDKDELDPVISQLYPYKQVTDKNEEGYRYNLLPKIYESCNHTPTGSFFTPEEAINNPIVLEVFEKYYKFTTKTNSSGDFMIWGVPLGTQIVHASIDVSNIGCYSMRPYQFINQGVSPSKFESSLKFKASENLDTLPQIVIQNKVAEVVPFWGDDELCNVGITRIDFDLRDSGIEVTPSATFIGSVITDDNSNYVDVAGNPGPAQGALCTLTTGTGVIETVRHTVFKEADGCTPKLEYFALENGGKVIDGNGTWVTQVPMNLDFKITNEYGEEVLSNDPKIGIPTKGKYRFRISFDTAGSSIRSGSYLVPNLREYTVDNAGELVTNPTDPYESPTPESVYEDSTAASPSYTFSNKLMDYPLDSDESWENSPAYKCEDYFYNFQPNKVYTISNFIDNYRKNYSINSSGSYAGTTPMASRWRFLGIKSINPPAESRCTDITKEFPVNDAFRGGSTIFSQSQINRIVQMMTIMMCALLIGVMGVNMFFQFASFATTASTCVGAATVSLIAPAVLLAPGLGLAIALGLLIPLYWGFMAGLLWRSFYVVRRIYSYPTCEPCNCGVAFRIRIPFSGVLDLPELTIIETQGDDPQSVGNCDQEYYLRGYNVNTRFWRLQGSGPRGCYEFTFRFVRIMLAYGIGIAGMAVAAYIPGWGLPVISVVMGAAGVTLIIFTILDIFDLFRGLNEWRILADIYTGLCQGVINMKFSNNWVNGSLYHFKFMKKARTTDDAGIEIPEPIDFYPDRIIWKQVENDTTHYYYRSCPFDLQSGFINQNPAIDASSIVAWPMVSSAGLNESISHCGINYPTTIMELGALDPCVNELCGNENDECVFVDKLSASSFQPSDIILAVLIQIKISRLKPQQFKGTGINKWFGAAYTALSYGGGTFVPNTDITTNKRIGSMGAYTTTGRVIDGDIAQLLATNNMIGVSPFNLDLQDPYYGIGGGNTMNDWHLNYLFSYSNNRVARYANQLSLLAKDTKIQNCVLGGSDGLPHTQVVPYYIWNTKGIGGQLSSDYIFPPPLSCNGGDIASIGYQQGESTILPAPTNPEGNNSGDWSSPSMYGGTTLPPIQGKYQAKPWPIETKTKIRLGTGLFFYFGLRQGATSYDRFINEYLPPSEDE